MTVCVLAGCSFWERSKEEKVNCAVWSVENAPTGNHFVCSNSSDTFLYEYNGIYRVCEKTDELLIAYENLSFFTCTDAYIFFAVSNNGGQLYRYDLSSKETELLMDGKTPISMKSCGNDVIVVIEDNQKSTEYGHTEDYEYQVILYRNGVDKQELNKQIQASSGKEEQQQYSIYNMYDYTIVADNELENCEYPQIVYMEQDDFVYSCNPYNTYINYKGKIYCLDKYLDKLTEFVSATYFGGVDASHVCVDENKCYFIAQYSKNGAWGYQYNPSADFKAADCFCSYDLETGECELLYKTDKHEQIAGFSIEKGWILLLRGDEVYQYNLSSKKENYVTEYSDYEDWRWLYFESYKGKTYVLKEEGGTDYLTVLDIITE
jgi:WD40 repeat protein